MPKSPVVYLLRRLADDLETGKWCKWGANLTMAQPGVELNPMTGECELDGTRHFRAGDEVTVTLVLTAPRDTPSPGEET